MSSSASFSDIAISVRGLSKSYTIVHEDQKHTLATEALLHSLKNIGKKPASETFWALQDVSFDIHKGDVVGIIGRNGAGKSTLLKVLSRITEPTRGQIDLYGRVGSLLEVGTGFHPELTGRENVYLNGAILGMSKREIASHFDAIVEFAEVEKFLDTPVKRYSSGMYVRLAFAVAAHLNPEILIVDEVLAVGDAQFQKKCLGKMQDVSQQEGKTVLFVSHNMGSIRSLCRSTLWLKNGHLFMSGRTMDVVNAYTEEAFDAASAVINLQDAVRPTGLGEQLRVNQVVFNNGGSICHGESLSIRLKYETQSAFEDVTFGVGFATMEGTRLMTIESNTDGNYFEVARKADDEIEVTMDCLLLQPGHYTFDIGVGSGSRALDYLPGCAYLEVLPGPNTPSTLYDRPGEGVRPPATWRMNRFPIHSPVAAGKLKIG